MATTEIYTNSGRVTVDLQADRAQIVERLIDRGAPSYDTRGELEALRSRVDNLEDMMRSLLLGSSRRTFQHMLQHAGYRIND